MSIAQVEFPESLDLSIPIDFGPAWWKDDLHGRVFKEFCGPKVKSVLEIGSFVGRSTVFWLQQNRGASVYCVDPWEDQAVAGDGMRYAEHFSRQPLFTQFCRNLYDYRDRLAMFKGLSKFEIPELSKFITPPNLIYIDGDHSANAVLYDVTQCLKYWPQAQILGDDWTWGTVQEGIYQAASTWSGPGPFPYIHHEDDIWWLGRR